MFSNSDEVTVLTFADEFLVFFSIGLEVKNVKHFNALEALIAKNINTYKS